MNRNEFKKLLNNRILVLDGAYGTEFMKAGYDTKTPIELLNINEPQAVEALQKKYVQAGSDILLTNTFSANQPKLKEFGCLESFARINAQAVEIAKRAAEGKSLVFGDMSTLGEFPSPMGKMDMDDSVNYYTNQAKILLEAGVDGFIIETMSDIKEVKAAVRAVRSITQDLPLIVQMTFDESLRVLTGTSVEIFASVFNDLDVDVIGANCTLSPDKMLKVLEILAQHTDKYISIEPNAGKPVFDGKTLCYKTTPEEFGIYIEDYIDFGANIIGGCCGTGPEHIAMVSHFVRNRKPVTRANKIKQALSSRTEYRMVKPFCMIGERINPASRKSFQDEIVEGNFSNLLKEASSQMQEGSTVIDVNLGIEKLLTPDHFKNAIIELDRQSSLPISFDIQTANNLEIALREYAGRPLINSARVTEKSLGSRIELLKKYGGMLILLAMGKEIPEKAEDRVKLIMEGIKILEENGISRDRVLADTIVLSFGANKSPFETLETVKMLAKEGIATTIGLSNLSFGMPDRSELNGVFLAQAVANGLNASIVNTGDEFVMKNLKSALILRGDKLVETKVKYEDPVIQYLLSGNSKDLKAEVEKLLKSSSPLKVSQEVLSESMKQIGNMYSRGDIYLPHLLLASETAQPVFDYLNSFISEGKSFKGKVVLATVEGDIHDIGKKIIGTVLKSGGFEIIDAGKDITADKIVEVVKKEKPDILGLSAMMTTTVGRVAEVASLLKKEGIKVRLITGGASMTENLAKEFGADGYGKDASTVVDLCNSLML